MVRSNSAHKHQWVVFLEGSAGGAFHNSETRQGIEVETNAEEGSLNVSDRKEG